MLRSALCVLVLAAPWLLSAPAVARATADDEVRRLTSAAITLAVKAGPATGYARGHTQGRHDGWPDRSPAGLKALEREEDELILRLNAIEAGSVRSERLDYQRLRTHLGDRRALRVCRRELWNIDHMWGWHALLPMVSERQPVSDAAERAAALVRWAALPKFVAQEKAWLVTGLDAGYSAPQSIVRLMIDQLRSLAREDAKALLSPAIRASDPAFKARYAEVLKHKAAPALTGLADYLERDYLPRARAKLGVSALPNGAACYEASLAAWTSSPMGSVAVRKAGEEAVDRNLAEALILARPLGLESLDQIVARLRDDPANRFQSEEDMLTASRRTVERARAPMLAAFAMSQDRPLKVEPLRPFQLGAGVTSHFEPAAAQAPAVFRVASERWAQETRSAAEITAFHEGYPGHHLQFALAPDRASALAAIMPLAAYTEGWGRYAERLADEHGLYESRLAPIQRRLWPSRGMVADPGLHLDGWSRERTVHYLLEAGRFSRGEIEALVDRMAVMPGQVTAYDVGGLEFAALRDQAVKRLGKRFDAAAFHKMLLETGPVPLAALRERAVAWIETQARSSSRP
ncbi:MAG: DUF885 domain-containing protein [Caulobacter sp.]